MFSPRKLDLFVLLFICFAAFWWRLGALGLIDPDEPFYAQTAHEMAESGDWLTPHIYGAPQFEKPIFYYWLVAASFKVLGESEFAGRLPTALFATALVLLTWTFGSKAWNRRAGFLGALVLATGLEFCVMSRLMLTDVPLAFFLAGSVFAYWMATRDEAKRDLWLLLHLAGAGFAVLTKGPIGSLIPLMAVLAFSLSTKTPLLFRRRGFWWGLGAYAVIVFPWYGLMFAQRARQFWAEFFVRDNFLRMVRAEHPANNHLWYYPGLLVLGSIPWMPAVAMTIRRAFHDWRAREAAWFQWCWLLTSLVFLTLAQSKLPSYAFYLFVPLALLCGHTLDSLLKRGFASSGERTLVTALAAIQCVGVFAAPLLKIARPFEAPVNLLSALLAGSIAFLLYGRLRQWILISAASSLGLLGGAFTIALPAVEAESSARPVAEAILRLRQDDEPILCGKFLARGIIFYARAPVTIIAKDNHPFWATHPLPIILWEKGLTDFLRTHPSAICTLRKSEWNSLRYMDAFREREGYEEIGENIVVRAKGAEALERGR